MKKYIFKIKEHPEYGTLGFVPSWYPGGDPLSGMAVAHDILEHFPHDDGSAEGEYMALGASLFIRGDSGYYGHKGGNSNPAENIASDLPMVWSTHRFQHFRETIKPCGLCRDSEILEQAREAITHWLKECEYMDESEKPDAETCERVARWIAKGYQKARKRYREHNCHSIAWSLFRPIEEEADKALKHADEMMELTVWVDFKNLTVKVCCDYPSGMYEE
jgi:hypothetical protein